MWQPDLGRTFTDFTGRLSTTWYANVAVKLRWMSAPAGRFNPNGAVTKDNLSGVLVRALGLTEAEAGINAIHSTDGYRFKHPRQLGYRVLAQELQLYWNRPNSLTSIELWPTTAITRGDFAYAVREAANAGWRVWGAQKYEDITLPAMSAVQRKVVEYGFKYVGYPYIYADEGPSGFDCSGFVWWTLREGMGNATARGYKGWSIPQRSSYTMAAAGSRIGYRDLKTGDLLFWDTDGEYTMKAAAVGHAGVYAGKGWMIHSSGSRGGVSLSWMGDGYWRERLVWGRRIM